MHRPKMNDQFIFFSWEWMSSLSTVTVREPVHQAATIQQFRTKVESVDRRRIACSVWKPGSFVVSL